MNYLNRTQLDLYRTWKQTFKALKKEGLFVTGRCKTEPFLSRLNQLNCSIYKNLRPANF